MIKRLFLATTTALSLSTAALAQGSGSAPQTEPAGVLTGSHSTAPAYPRVFMTRAKGLAMIASTNPSVQNALARIKANAAGDVTNVANFTTPYVGTDLTSEENAWSIPGGAAPAALQLALYAYLADLNAGFGDSTTALAAHNAAVKIISAWIAGGFQTADGTKITSYTQFTTGGVYNAGVGASVELDIGRGIIPWVDAIDLLEGDGLDATTGHTFATNVIQLGQLLLPAANFHFSNPTASYPQTGCGRFDNQSWQGILALAAVARFSDNVAVENALAGQDDGTLLDVSIPMQIEGNFYGSGDQPRTCSPGSYNTPGSFFQTTVVAPGEVVDRYRDGNAGDPLTYPLGLLAQVVQVADVMGAAGYDVADYKGPLGQSLQLSLDYYAQYINQYLTLQGGYLLPASGTFNDYAQYAGAQLTSSAANVTVEGKDAILPPYVIGLHLYPADTSIQNVIAKAVSLATGISPPPATPTTAYDAFPDSVSWSDWFVPTK